MDVSTQQHLLGPGFGAKRAGIIFLITLIALLFSDYLLARFVLGFPEILNSTSLWQTDDQQNAARTILVTLINPAVTLLTAYIFLARYFPTTSLGSICEQFGMEQPIPVKKIAVGFCCGAAYVTVFMVARQFFPTGGMTTLHPDNIINSASAVGKAVFVISACTIVPVAEEFLFRGILYQGIAQSWEKVISTLCVSFMFIALHPASIGSGDWLTHAALYCFPFVLILLREVSATLYLPIGAHAGFNFTEILL